MKKLFIITIACLMLSQLVALNNSVHAAKKYGIVQEDVGRTFVPVRYAAETFGFKVKWVSAENKVVLSNAKGKVEFVVASSYAAVNGQQQKIDAAPFNMAGTVYVPVRFAAETLGAKVTWSKEGKITFSNEALKTELETVTLRRIQQAINQPVAAGSSKVSVGSKTFSVTTVHIDLYHPTVKLDAAYANNKIGTAEPLKQMAERSDAAVAINGTFFDAYTADDNNKIPYGYIIKDGVVISKASGNQRTTFVYTKDGDALIVDGEDELLTYTKSGSVLTALQVGPRLVRNGKVDSNPEAEGFKDPKVLTNSGARSALGITKNGKLLLMTTSGATIPQLAEIMVKLGAVDAMNLDGGASSGLYANGKYLTTPGRDLSNALIVTYNK